MTAKTTQEPGYAEFEAAWDEFFVTVRRARGRAAAEPGALTSSQFHLLDALERGTASRVSDLAEAAGITPPTATRMLDLLERQCVIERSRRSDDRRVVSVTLTDVGRERVRAHRRRVAVRRKLVFEALTTDERRQGARLLQRLAAVMDDL